MVLEIADIRVQRGAEDEFVTALRKAVPQVSATPGFRSIRVTRSIETPTRFVLLIEWDCVEAHLVNFRESERFTTWRGLIGPYFDGAPHTEHLEDVLTG